MGKILANGINIYYELHGEGPLLVLISGLGSNHTFWNPHIKPLSQHYQVLIFDNRGIGQTDAPEDPYTIEEMADDLAGLMDALYLDQGHILGLSMGSLIATSFAARYPQKVDKLVLCALFGRLSVQARLFFDAAFGVYRESKNDKWLHDLLAPWLFSPRFIEDPENSVFWAYDPKKIAHTFYSLNQHYTALRECDLRASLKDIEAQTLVIAGERDVLAPPEGALDMAIALPAAELQIMDNMGHLFNYEAPMEFSRLVIEFLEETGLS